MKLLKFYTVKSIFYEAIVTWPFATFKWLNEKLLYNQDLYKIWFQLEVDLILFSIYVWYNDVSPHTFDGSDVTAANMIPGEVDTKWLILS